MTKKLEADHAVPFDETVSTRAPSLRFETGAVPGRAGGPKGERMHAYVSADPINLVDPTGLEGEDPPITVNGSPCPDGWICTAPATGWYYTMSRSSTNGGSSDIYVTGRRRPRVATVPTRTQGNVTFSNGSYLLPQCIMNFMRGFDPSVDWSQVTLVDGLPIYILDPRMDGVTIGNRVRLRYRYYTSPLSNIRLLFHEFGHVGQWLRGELTFAGYIGSAIANRFDHDAMPVEAAASEYGAAALAAYANLPASERCS